ncbi:MAG: M28 family peptidase [Bacteroidia bacterium]|nr:M28 family peptidase [Bacteroidia bacterium]
MHTRRTTVLLLFISTLASYPVLAQTLPAPIQRNPAIISDNLKAHVAWLSSDALEGRGSGTAAIDSAAVYIAREFARYGLQPAGTAGFFQEFEVVKGVRRGASSLSLLRDGNSVFVDSLSYIPATFSADAGFSGPVVFAGYGMAGSPGTPGDYGSIDASGAVVLALHGVPADMNPHDPGVMQATSRAKALAAREAGAAALLLVDDAVVASREFRWDGSSSNAGLPVGRISRSAAAGLLLAAGIDSAVLSSSVPTQSARKQTEVSGRFSIELVRAKTRNVAGLLPGSSEPLRAQAIVVGAHYDHLGWGQEGSLYRGTEPMIHNGADDNASGTAGMLELAEYFAAQRPSRSMLFLAFSGEEMGLLGSAHWVSHPTVPLENIIAMINLDMIGRLPDSTRRLHVQGTGTSPVWNDLVTSSNGDFGFDLARIEDGQGSSDHSSFYGKNIPVLFFFTGLHSDYHRPSDDADKLNYTGLEEVTRFTAEVVRAIDRTRDAPAFTRVERKEAQQNMRFSVYVGTIPDYAHSGEGFRISGASPGSPAEKAGMKEGDIIVKFGETTVGNIYDYMAALGRHKAGEAVPVLVRRDETTIELRVELVGK